MLLEAACSRPVPPSTPEISLVEQPTNPGASYVAVKGIGSQAARALKKLQPGADEWSRVFAVRVLGPDNTASATPICLRWPFLTRPSANAAPIALLNNWRRVVFVIGRAMARRRTTGRRFW